MIKNFMLKMHRLTSNSILPYILNLFATDEVAMEGTNDKKFITVKQAKDLYLDNSWVFVDTRNNAIKDGATTRLLTTKTITISKNRMLKANISVPFYFYSSEKPEHVYISLILVVGDKEYFIGNSGKFLDKLVGKGGIILFEKELLIDFDLIPSSEIDTGIDNDIKVYINGYGKGKAGKTIALTNTAQSINRRVGDDSNSTNTPTDLFRTELILEEKIKGKIND